MPDLNDKPQKLQGLIDQLHAWAKELGFSELGITNTDLSLAEQRLFEWLDLGYHGDMEWMQHHGSKRSRPAELHPGTISVISVRMDYWPEPDELAHKVLADHNRAYISRYALGRDYHKLMRRRLQKLTDKIKQAIGPFGCRVFVDSAPVLEKPLAEKSGLGWIGKHTNLINQKAGSWFFLGEIYTDLALPSSPPQDKSHCGTCEACIDACPTRAIVSPYLLDARLCISYLTIEHKGIIPLELRPLLGNRVYGCDDCQLVCPWNRFAAITNEDDFKARQNLDDCQLLELFSWDKTQFEERLEGSAIRRIGYEQWQRNLAVALGNSLALTPANSDRRLPIKNALEQKRMGASALVKEHIDWALAQCPI